jgi:hypothetical protein
MMHDNLMHSHHEPGVQGKGCKEQIRNQTQHYGPGIPEHLREAYDCVKQNNSPNVERFDRDVKYNNSHRLKRLGKITGRINAEPHKAFKHHGNKHGD